MMAYILPCVYAFFACAAFCIIFNIRDFKIGVVSSFGGALAWFVYLLSAPFGSDIVQNLFAAFAVALFSELMARVFKAPATVFLIIGILPMVPGGGIYYTMEYCVNGNNAMFIEKGLHTFAIAGAIAVGVSLASSIVRIFISASYKKYKKDGKYDRNNC
ncbi:MAG: threonine/serine exporter family protein [Oscillospiraceae bacterium]